MRGLRGDCRRKITLVCEPCLVRESRCGGENPLRAACMRTALLMYHCVYQTENAQFVSIDERECFELLSEYWLIERS
ncbi:hypothetical protein BDW42DRAFT_175294, partial [Aspergillus taichungensis]